MILRREWLLPDIKRISSNQPNKHFWIKYLERWTFKRPQIQFCDNQPFHLRVFWGILEIVQNQGHHQKTIGYTYSFLPFGPRTVWFCILNINFKHSAFSNKLENPRRKFSNTSKDMLLYSCPYAPLCLVSEFATLYLIVGKILRRHRHFHYHLKKC